MKRTILTLVLLLVYLLSYTQSNNLFYYAYDDKIYLNPVTNKFVVEFIGAEDVSVFESNNLNQTKISPKVYEVSGDLLEIQNAGQGIYNVNQVYTVGEGLTLHMRNSVILKWNDGVPESQKNILISQYGLTETKSTRLYTIYQVNNPLPISQMIYETGNVKYCYPVFMTLAESHQYIPNDEHFGHQFYLHNVGQQLNDYHYGTEDADIDAPEAWDITFGSSDVVVAVVDGGGITDNHPDLPSSRQIRLPGSNFHPYDGLSNDDPSPTTNGDAHGNACAGIIGAEMDNNEGIAGIAPGCMIMPIKIPITGNIYDTQIYADAITFAVDNGAMIISNSWGFDTDMSNVFPEIVEAIQDAVDQGVVVVFSAGNTGYHQAFGDNGYVTFPANAEISGLITVGASDRDDLVADYSPIDTEVEITAPSHTGYDLWFPGEAQNIWTLDIPGNAGYNPWYQNSSLYLPANGEVRPSWGVNNLSYTARMGGTSAAAPQVAGTVALMLSVNPCLSLEQILDILFNTAEKVGGYDYNWDLNNPGHSYVLGYGRLNAFLAVEAAQQMITADVDLYIKDVPEDFGSEPSNAELLWLSDDIWVRNQQDGFTNQLHENPEYSASSPVYVYVRVRNKNCTPSLGTEELHLYWAKASTALSWPNSWNGSITNPALMGDQIGMQVINSIDVGDQTIVEFEWYPPDPADYNGINNQPWHFCLLARILATNDPMNDETSGVWWNMGYNVEYNNNIAWKNLSVVDIIPGVAGGDWNDDKLVGATISIGNTSNETATFDLEFKSPKIVYGKPITEAAEVRIALDDLTWQKWVEGGYNGHNISIFREERNQLVIEGPNAKLENISYQAYEKSLVNLSFNFLTKELSDKTKFEYHVIQTMASSEDVLGGEIFKINIPSRAGFSANAGDDEEISKDEEVGLSAEQINENAIYNWYDPNGVLIHTGESLMVTPEVTKKYKLEVIATSDGFKDYDVVEVKVKEAEILGITPNPASDYVTIEYDAQNVNSAYIMLSMPYTSSTEIYALDISQGQISINISSYQAGVYGLILVADGQIVDMQGLIIN